ncbi:hypothetical protein GCM10010435_24040 [Winogradskya consettensis]
MTVGGQQGLRLDRVTQPGTGAVALDDIHIRRVQTSAGQSLPDHPLLRGPVRRGQTVGGTVLVDGATAYDSKDLMPVATSVRHPLDQDETGALGPARPISGGGIRLASAVRREAVLSRELGEDLGAGDDRDTTDQRHLTLTGPQRLSGPVQCDQRRRTRRINRDGGAFEAERVRHPTRDHAVRAPGQQVTLSFGGNLAAEAVPGVGSTDEHTHRTPAKRSRVNACPLEGLPRHLEQQPLLRIHRQGLTRRDPEQARIEFRGVVDESTRAGERGVGGHEPAAVVGERGNAVPATEDEPPQVLR